MSNTTGSTSMMFNSGNRRVRTKTQLDNTNRRIKSLSIESDMVRLAWTSQPATSGNGGDAISLNFNSDYGGVGYTNLYTNNAGDFHAYASRLATTGTLWEIEQDNKGVQYIGEAKTCHYYATMTLSQTDDNKGVIGTSAFDGGGSTYTSTTLPVVVVDNSGSGGAGFSATTVINASGEPTGILVTNPGHSYNTVPSISFDAHGGGNIGGMSATAVISETTVNLAVFKKGKNEADFAILNPSTVGDVVCSADNITSTNCTVSFIAPIEVGDIIETRVQTQAGEVLGYKLYHLTLSLRPILLQGGKPTDS